jgi:hypothetical protein
MATRAAPMPRSPHRRTWWQVRRQGGRYVVRRRRGHGGAGDGDGGQAARAGDALHDGRRRRQVGGCAGAGRLVGAAIDGVDDDLRLDVDRGHQRHAAVEASFVDPCWLPVRQRRHRADMHQQRQASAGDERRSPRAGGSRRGHRRLPAHCTRFMPITCCRRLQRWLKSGVGLSAKIYSPVDHTDAGAKHRRSAISASGRPRRPRARGSNVAVPPARRL